ncbi:hypothetical protein HYFRA_00001618 [Hymenoscyphus fraxineus]|uniref:Fe2OG dioxygenase domain-containing protein n=1 Tax=Hymenoscyphus fraxineus TaxID=746836 RepID=A0A9N9LA24_9HELO|nr:hypothetical protein HYFRA_00001618 [Hymenoscyphus fraxineus]
MGSTQETEFPVIDFTQYPSNPSEISSQIFEAFHQWGFLVLKGHGIPKGDVEEIFSLSKEFFAQPLEAKQEKPLNLHGQGYDLKESIIGVHEALCFGNITNSTLSPDSNFTPFWTPQKRRTIETFRSKCQSLSTLLFTALATQMHIPPSFFTTPHNPHKTPGNALRLIHYHPLSNPPRKPDITPRLCEHTDWGTMTFLFATEPGLEVQTPDGKSWVTAPVVDDAIVVNIADGLCLSTGKTLKSTVHRVTWDVVPWDKERFSVAFFVNANADAPIRVLEQSDAGNFVEKKGAIKATYGDYQNVRIKMIEKHDNHISDEEVVIDPVLWEMVKGLGAGVGEDLEKNDEEVRI